MPIVRKVMDLRTSRAICLPKSWLEYFEKETGEEIAEVAIEVDRVLTISPIFSKKKVEATA
jgi:protein tyrosine/serine phosphatase